MQQSYEAHLLHPVCDMNAPNVPYASYQASLPPPTPLTALCYNKWIWHLNQGIINLFVWHVTISWLKIPSSTSSVMSYVLSCSEEMYCNWRIPVEKPSFHSRPGTQALIHSDVSGVTCKQTILVQWFYLYWVTISLSGMFSNGRSICFYPRGLLHCFMYTQIIGISNIIASSSRVSYFISSLGRGDNKT